LTHSGRLTHKVVTRQPWIRRRSGKVRRLQTDILTTEPRRRTCSAENLFCWISVRPRVPEFVCTVTPKCLRSEVSVHHNIHNTIMTTSRFFHSNKLVSFRTSTSTDKTAKMRYFFLRRNKAETYSIRCPRSTLLYIKITFRHFRTQC